MADQREQEIAIMEGEMAAASDAYFDARPHLDSKACRLTFDAGFQKGWNRAQAQTAGYPPDRVPMPQNEAQAELMAKLGTKWLEQNAPHRLVQADDQARRDAAVAALIRKAIYYPDGELRESAEVLAIDFMKAERIQ